MANFKKCPHCSYNLIKTNKYNILKCEFCGFEKEIETRTLNNKIIILLNILAVLILTA